MPPDLTIGSAPAPSRDGLQANAPSATRAAAQTVASAGFGVAAAPSVKPGVQESRVVLDPASDRVVLEYFDATGTLTNSLPSQRQLDAYRLAAAAAPDTHRAEKS